MRRSSLGKILHFSLRDSKGPKERKHSSELRNFPPGSSVLVFCTESKRWKGPFKFIHIKKETVVVQTDHGRTFFPSACVKPYVSR